MRAVLLGLGGLLFAVPVVMADQIETPSCVEVSKEAPYQAYGYTHIVVIENGCDGRVTCRVSTNVDPDVVTVTVEPEATSRTATRRGSPSSEFEARVTCTE